MMYFIQEELLSDGLSSEIQKLKINIARTCFGTAM